MIDHLPSITKMFNLVVQEERQCAIGSGSSSPSNSLAFQASLQESSITTLSLVSSTLCRNDIFIEKSQGKIDQSVGC